MENFSYGQQLGISATSTFSNEGTMNAQATSTLDLGVDGTTESLNNKGWVNVYGGDLAISGNFTVSGGG